MTRSIHHRIVNEPVPEDVGIIRITAEVLDKDDYHSTKSFASFVQDFLQDECRSKQELKDFLLGEGVDDDSVNSALMDLVDYVDEVTRLRSYGYSRESVLDVWLKLDYYSEDVEAEFVEEIQRLQEAARRILDALNALDPNSEDLVHNQIQMEEEFEVTSNTRLRPASKKVVKSLTRKIYNKKIQKENNKNKKKKIYKEISLEECAICLEEFDNGKRVTTLPCGHDFGDECIVKWLDTNHVCPLCRFELPCEEDTRVDLV